MEAKEQVRQRLSLEEVVGEVVALKPVGGGRLKGLCPFHNEKTPSFHVVPAQGYYYCFGCHAKGDLFGFVEQTQNLDFRGALKVLAARAGIELPEHAPRSQHSRTILELNDDAQAWFVARLRDNEVARAYLAGRGLTPETVETWGLGLAPDGWTGLTDHLSREGTLRGALVEAGLAKDKAGRVYDTFRNRITIPIRDAYGRTVGFSGRTLGDDPAKYLNTPETAVFKKGDLLFGLPEARGKIRESHAAIVVEGHMDVIALHQAGFTAAVGAQSATLTTGQIAALVRLGVTHLYFAFDADDAGVRATLAGCEAVARQMFVRVVKLPAKDPAEVVQQDPGAFRTALRRAESEVDYRISHAQEGLDLARPDGHQRFLQRLKVGMRGTRADDPVAGELVARVARMTGTPAADLRRYAGDAGAAAPSSLAVAQRAALDQLTALRMSLATMLLLEPDAFRENSYHLLNVLPSTDPLTRFVRRCGECGTEVRDLLKHLPDDEHVHFALPHLAKGGGKVPPGKFDRDLWSYAHAVGVPATNDAAHVAHLLKTGRLDAYGEERKASIAQKLANNETNWIERLVRSPDLEKVLRGVAPKLRPNIVHQQSEQQAA